MTTYIRKYYLHRRVKQDGYTLSLEHCHRTINVAPSMVEDAKANKYLLELQQQHNYGVQLSNPLINEN